MKSFAVVSLALTLAACATPAAAPPNFNIMAVPKELDARGISFNIGRVPGEDALTLGVKFKIAETDNASELTDAVWMEAAQKAAPTGCSVKSLTPTPEGGRKATYECR